MPRARCRRRRPRGRARSNHPHPWPAELSAEETVVYPAGTTLFRERDGVKSVQIIVSGVVRTSVMRVGGELFLNVCGPGWPLSAVPALLEGIQVTTAVAVTETEVNRCSLDRFQRLRRDVPAVADWLQRMLAEEAASQLHRWATVVPKGTREGLTWLLLHLFRVAGRPMPNGSLKLGFHVPVTALAE